MKIKGEVRLFFSFFIDLNNKQYTKMS